MSKDKKDAIRLVLQLLGLAFLCGAAGLRIQNNTTRGEVQEIRIDKVEVHMVRQTTNQEWIIDALKRLEGRD